MRRTHRALACAVLGSVVIGAALEARAQVPRPSLHRRIPHPGLALSGEDAEGATFGWSMIMADVGGPDANDDLVIASVNSDKFLGHGSTIVECGSAWLMSGGSLTLDTTNPKIEHSSPEDSQQFGTFTPSAGSVDGSSTWTFIGAIGTDVTFPGYTGVVPNAGTVEVFDLAAAGPPLMSLIAPIASNEPSQAPSAPPVAVGLFGHSVAIGDVNQDGYGDLVVGAPYSDQFKGRVYLFFGDATGSLSTWIGLQSPVTTSKEDFGVSVMATDLDDDGHAEILVGASDRHSTTTPQGAGRTHIYDWGDLAALSTGALHVVTPSQTIEPPNGFKTPAGWFGWTMFDLGEIGGYSYPNGRGDIAVHAEATDAGSTPFAGALFVFNAWDAGQPHASNEPYVDSVPVVLQTPTITSGSVTVHAPADRRPVRSRMCDRRVDRRNGQSGSRAIRRRARR
jgi:hypothetical protein